jgi:hypothetical protein
VRRLAEYAIARKLRDELLELVVVREGRELTLWAGHNRPSEASEQQPQASERPPEAPEHLTCPWRGAA